MNLTQLQSLLAPADGVTSVTGAALGSAGIAAVLAMYCGGTLEISSATLSTDEQAQSVTVTGSSVLLAITMQVGATFALQGGIPQLTMASAEKDTSAWGFARSFGTVGDPLLRALSFDQPRWTLLSAATDDRSAGLWLSAEWTPPPALSAIAWLLGESAGPLAVAGLLQLTGGLPQAAFAAGQPVQRSFHGIVLALQLMVRSDVFPGDTPARDVCLGSYELAVGLSNTAGSVTVPASVLLTTDFDLITIEADAGTMPAVTLDDLAGWIGGSELASSGLPPGLSTAALQLQRLQIVLSTASKGVIGVSITIGLGGTWAVVPDVLTIDGVTLDVYVSDPLGSGRAFASTVSGELSVDVSGGDPIVIDVAAAFPDFTVQGALPEAVDNPPPLAGVMAGGHGVGSSAGFGGDLTVQSLDILAQPSTSTYLFTIATAEDWRIAPGAALTGLGVRVLYSAGDLSAALEAGLMLGGVNVALAADYDSTSGGWLLSGTTGPGQAIAIGAIVQDMESLFGATTSLPASLEGLTVVDLAVALNTQSLNASLGLSARFPVNGTPLDATIAIAYARTQTGGFTADVSGVAAVGGQQFALVFDEASDP